jgi:hypothetical protein
VRLVDDEHGGGATLVDHMDEGLFDVGPELGATMRGGRTPSSMASVRYRARGDTAVSHR